MKQGVKNIRRNKMFSVASIATMAACIFLFGLFYSIVVNFSYIVEKAEEGVAITVFFNEDTTKEQKDIFLKYKKSSVIPLSMCEKVTLDNIEAAYQNVGGVYKRENGFKLKDGLKIAKDFIK